MERVAHYRILDKLGEGGAGVVYRALDERLEREVALKFLTDATASDAASVARFRRESRIASGLAHPHICRVHEFGSFEGRDFLVMELLDGRPLSRLVADAALPLDRVLELGVQIADALEAAHERGVVHRDVKPSNVFVTRLGLAKLLDFGLARSVGPVEGSEPRVSLTGTVMGTPTHMAPEQIRGAPPDLRVDIFAFGVVLYEMSTGRQPFRATSPFHVLQRVLYDAPLPPSRWNPALPAGFDAVVGGALEKDPARRFQSIADVRAALAEVRRAQDSPTVEFGPPRSTAGDEGRTSAGLDGVALEARVVEPWDAVARDSRDFAERGDGAMYWFRVPLGAVASADGFRSALLPALENPRVTRVCFVLDGSAPTVADAWRELVIPLVASWAGRRARQVSLHERPSGGEFREALTDRLLLAWCFADLSMEFGPAFKLFLPSDPDGSSSDAQIYLATTPRDLDSPRGARLSVGFPETVLRVRGAPGNPLASALDRTARRWDARILR